MVGTNILIWIFVTLIINEDQTLGDVTFEEESRKLKLSLSKEFPDERKDLNNEFRLKETVLNILKCKLGSPIQISTSHETDCEKHLKKQSQITQKLLLQYNSLQKEPDKDLTAHSKWITTVLKLSKENPDKTEKNWKEINKESQTEDIRSDREVRERTGIREAGKQNKKECVEDTYISKDCNVCRCRKGSWVCTQVNCKHPRNPLPYSNFDMIDKQMYQKISAKATGCLAGQKVFVEENKECPCNCVLPSVMVCDLCPAVRKNSKPQERKTTTEPTTQDDQDYQYVYD